MNSNAKNPAALAGAHRVRKNDLAGCQIVTEDTITPEHLQSLRAAWLARRLPINPAMAHAVAALAFSVAEVR